MEFYNLEVKFVTIDISNAVLILRIYVCLQCGLSSESNDKAMLEL